MSAANSVNSRARSVRSVFVVAVEPGGETGGDLPLALVGEGDVLLCLVGGAGVVCAPARVLGPEDPLVPAPALRKLPNEGGEGV